MSEENKKIKIVDGDGSTLDISPVYNHIKDVIPKKKNTKKDIITSFTGVLTSVFEPESESEFVDFDDAFTSTFSIACTTSNPSITFPNVA